MSPWALPSLLNATGPQPPMSPWALPSLLNATGPQPPMSADLSAFFSSAGWLLVLACLALGWILHAFNADRRELRHLASLLGLRLRGGPFRSAWLEGRLMSASVRVCFTTTERGQRLELRIRPAVMPDRFWLDQIGAKSPGDVQQQAWVAILLPKLEPPQLATEIEQRLAQVLPHLQRLDVPTPHAPPGSAVSTQSRQLLSEGADPLRMVPLTFAFFLLLIGMLSWSMPEVFRRDAVIVISSVLAVLLPTMFGAVQTTRQRRSIQRLAKALQLEPKSNLWRGAEAEGYVDGLPVRIAHRYDWDRNHTHLRLGRDGAIRTVPLSWNQSDPDQSRSPVGNQTGDDHFDSEVQILTPLQPLEFGLLDAKARAALLELKARCPFPTRIDAAGIHIQLPGVQTSPALLGPIVEQAAVVADLLSREGRPQQLLTEVLLHDPMPEVRKRALELLISRFSINAPLRTALLKALHDSSRAVRHRAACLLDRDGIETLGRLLLDDDEPWPTLAAQALARLKEGIDAALPLLRAGLERPVARGQAASALATLRDTESVPRLIALCRASQEANEQLTLIRALGALEDVRASMVLVEKLEGPTLHAAIAALQVCGDRNAVEPLHRLARSGGSEQQSLARAAMTAIQTRLGLRGEGWLEVMDSGGVQGALTVATGGSQGALTIATGGSQGALSVATGGAQGALTVATDRAAGALELATNQAGGTLDRAAPEGGAEGALSVVAGGAEGALSVAWGGAEGALSVAAGKEAKAEGRPAVTTADDPSVSPEAAIDPVDPAGVHARTATVRSPG